MKKQLIHSVDATNLGLLGSRGLRAECYRLGNFVYMTGQTGITLDGRFNTAGDPAGQARQGCENIKTLVGMGGGSTSDGVKLTAHLPGPKPRGAGYSVLPNVFQGQPS